MAAELVTPDAIQLHGPPGRGSDLPAAYRGKGRPARPYHMDADNTAPFRHRVHVSIDGQERHHRHLGLRPAETILAAIADERRPADLCTPGHIFPLRAREARAWCGRSDEGSVSLCRLGAPARQRDLREVMKDDGTMARLADSRSSARSTTFKICPSRTSSSTATSDDSLIHRVADTRLPTAYGGEFRAVVYNTHAGWPPSTLALIKGEIFRGAGDPCAGRAPIPPRDVFGFDSSTPGRSSSSPWRLTAKEGAGVLLYLQPEGKGLRTAKPGAPGTSRRLRHRRPRSLRDAGDPQAQARHQQPQKPRGPVRLRPGGHQLRPLPHAPRHHPARRRRGVRPSALTRR